MPLDEKSRLKLDKVFMAFGSLMKAVDRQTLNDGALKEFADAAWLWSIRNVYQIVDELYQMSEKAEPQSPPSPPQEPSIETTVITVAGMTLQRQGTNKNGPWKLYKITDEHGINYFTFHTSFQLGEACEIDWKWNVDGEKKWRTIPNTPRPASAYKVENDGTVHARNAPVMSEPDDDIPF